MQVCYASEAAPDATANQDHAIHAGPLVAVFDGASVPPGMDTGCIHGTSWYVTRLAENLATVTTPDLSLPEILAEAIRAVREDHGEQCDLDHPGTPTAAVGIIRDQGEHLDYLILCDIALVVDRDDNSSQFLTDERFGAAVADLRDYARAHQTTFGSDDHAALLRHITSMRLQRINRPGGYWVAGAQPGAAHHAITGKLPLSGVDRVRRAALLTDGAADAVTRYQLHTWPTLLDTLTTHGPAELIRQVRAAELSDDTGDGQARYKRHDDATAVLCQFHPQEQP
ncbi:protein phosphatase 2C domain-containing protein [Natronosporangium hydrolyticum]|uniref:Protein phosphatase 2C domain-containing protein n=1 Tax=Natronosporangium hydrolyticum TaxID=2811111 RepID=A0A895YGH4_9ACTN|nr:protein phosphatase 2C domain-containing protein [Natronosporangium hydrolyticum]QSB15175.1 protein phosphatase 2C domain-containing protein [Natronosporangium hydrolyticum]